MSKDKEPYKKSRKFYNQIIEGLDKGIEQERAVKKAERELRFDIDKWINE